VACMGSRKDPGWGGGEVELLHDAALASALWGIRVLTFPDWTPYRRNLGKVSREERRELASDSRRTRWSVVVLQYRMRLKERRVGQRPCSKGQGGWTHLALASLTFILGLARSSLNRWLCSRRRRSLSSDIDCLCGRFIVVYLGGRIGGGELWERVSCHSGHNEWASAAEAVWAARLTWW